MTNDDKRAFEGLLEDYVGLDESADIVVRQLRKISNPDSRRKVINELRNIENRRLELLDQMHRLAKLDPDIKGGIALADRGKMPRNYIISHWNLL